jgi:SAM-dependent methyltransferase
MSFSKEWENIYDNNQQMIMWPWSDLVAYVMRYSKPKNDGLKVLEIGCGAGPNIAFFQSIKADYYATEGSQTIVNYLINKYPSLAGKIKVADFTKELPFDETFDLIVDRAAITHNTTAAIKNCIALISEHLKPGGIFIGIDWFSTSHSEFNKGIFVGDKNTKDDFPDGQFHKVGQVHFSDGPHIRELFKDFEFIKLEQKVVTQEFPQSDFRQAYWDFAVKKIRK